MRTKLFLIISVTVLVALLILQIHNVSLYPASKGFDGNDHLQYVTLLQKQHRVPLANEGWELYQPPFYYFLLSFLPTVKAMQYFGIFIWILYILLTFYFLIRNYNRQTAFIGSLFVASLPLLLYETPQITNELFAGLMISITLVYYLIVYKKNALIKSGIIVGVLLGLALLTKATAWILVLCIIIDQLFESKHRATKPLSAAAIVTILISGWFYLRNLIIFHNPFASSIDFMKMRVAQDPGYRDIGFFLNPMGFLKLDVNYAHHYSLWAGTYFSWFYDGHNVMLPVQQFSKIGAVLILASLPITLAFLLGYFQGLKKITSQNRILLLYPALLFLSYIAYNFRLPYYSTVKAIFLISSTIPWVYFVCRGIEPLLKKYPYIVYIYVLLYIFVIYKIFWIIAWWYRM